MRIGFKSGAGLAIGIMLVLALGVSFYISTRRLLDANAWVTHTYRVKGELEHVISVLKDAETGQRGFILTGEESYLQPYNAAAEEIPHDIEHLGQIMDGQATGETDLGRLRALTQAKLEELNETITLRKNQGMDAAMPVILSGRGREIMNRLRSLVDSMQNREDALLEARSAAAAQSARLTIMTVALWMPASLLILSVGLLMVLRRSRLEASPVGFTEPHLKWSSSLWGYGLAVVVTVLASLLRWWLEQTFGNLNATFITFFPAVLLVALVAGGGPGVVVTILSAAIASYYFIEPGGRFAVETTGSIISLGVFTGTCIFISILAERLRRSRWAEAFGTAKQQEAEELARQNEQITRQSEALARQNQELQSLGREIQSLNSELAAREHVLQKLLEAARLAGNEASVMNDICAAAMEMLGPSVSAVVVFERQDDRLVIRAGTGFDVGQSEKWPLEGTFAGLVMRENRTTSLNDASLRPDLRLLSSSGRAPFQAAVSAPLQVGGRPFGLVMAYSTCTQEWTVEQSHMVEWLSSQCGHILETLRLQEQLRQSAEQNRLLSDLLERSEQPFGMGYPDGRLGHVNGAFERLTGYSREELMTMDWVSVLTPPEWQEVEQAKLKELDLTGQPVRYEKEYIRKDGRRVPIELLVHLVKSDEGEPLYYYSFLTDLTARKRAEAEREWAARQRRLALDAASLGWWHYDPISRVSTWDDRYSEILGVSRHETPNEGILAHLHPDDLPRVRAAVEASLSPADPKPYQAEYRVVSSDGSERWVEAHGVAAFEGDGSARHAVSIVGTVADITQRKLTEQAQARLAAIVESTDDAVISMDMSGNILTWNAGAERLFGYRVDEILGRPTTVLLPASRVGEEEEILARLRTGNRVEHLETERVAKEGRRIDVSVTSSPLTDQDGRVIGAAKIIRDISERKQFESTLQRTLRRFELLSQTAGELLQVGDPQQVVESLCRKVMEHIDCCVFFNFLVDERKGKLRLNAYAGILQEEAAKIEWLDFGTGVCGCAARDGCRIVAEHIPTTSDKRLELVRSYGLKAYACHPLLGTRSEVIGTLSFGTRLRETFTQDELSLMKAVADQVDVAMVRMKGERELRQLADDLTRSNKELEQFAYVASHDLQEPLRMVEAFLTRLVDRHSSALDEHALKYVGFAVQGSKRMSQLVSSLLEYSRIQRQILQLEPVCMKNIFDRAVTNCLVSIRESRASVASETLPTIMGDSLQLVQLLQNLIANAIKFQKQGVRPEVRVSACREMDRWRFCVEDNGIGIPPEQTGRIFLIFQRLHTQERYPGAGIGLSICKKIVERHGGQIWVESKPGSGSRFLFTIPS